MEKSAIENNIKPLKKGMSWNNSIQKSIQDMFSDTLSPQTIDFFQLLAYKNIHGFTELCNQLNVYILNDGLYLKAYHIDIVVEILTKQTRLPADLSTCLASETIWQEPLNDVITQLQKEKLPWLNTQAQHDSYGHHTLYHAKEMNFRSMKAAQELELFTKPSSLLCPLKELVAFIIECHDYIQGKPGDAALNHYATAELATAAAIKSWLFSHEKILNNLPQALLVCIDFMIDHMIVLATTLIFSEKKPQHLATIYALIEEQALRANILTPDVSNALLLNEIRTMDIIIGTTDVFAACIKAIINQKIAQQETHSWPNLTSFFKSQPIVLHDFFNSLFFVPYYLPHEHQQNHEAFLMSNVPHLQMSAELKIIKPSSKIISHQQHMLSDQAHRIITFIQKSQKLYQDNATEFKCFVDQWLNDSTLQEAVINVFFNHIDAEIAFISSLIPLISNNEKTLRTLGHPYPLIDSTTIQTDVKNLQGLAAFFRQACKITQIQLIKELLLNAVFQEGLMYVCSPIIHKKQQAITPHLNSKPLLYFIDLNDQHNNSPLNRLSFLNQVNTVKKREDWREYIHLNDDYNSDSDDDVCVLTRPS